MSNDFLFDVNPHESDKAKMPKDWQGPVKIMKIEERTTQSGGKQKNVEFVVANGDFEGTKMYKTFNTGLITNPAKVEELMADGLDREEAQAKADEGIEKANKFGRADWAKLVNAAGYINEKYATDEDKQRIAEERAYPLTGDFTDSMLEGKIVFTGTKPNDKGYQEPRWFKDADSLGDVNGSAPI